MQMSNTAPAPRSRSFVDDMQNEAASSNTSSKQDSSEITTSEQRVKVDSTSQQEQQPSVLRLRGLPYSCAEQGLRDFFKNFEIVDVVICARHGKIF
jgi:RNA recognition motif-containing protein